MDPLTMGLQFAGPLLNGLFGQQPQLPPELEAIYQFMMKQAHAARDYGNGVPMSAPQEQAALASDRGLAGGFMRQKQDQLAAAGMGGVDTPGMIGDRMTNLASQQTGQMVSLDSQHMLNSLNQRNLAKFQWAPSIAQGATGAAAGPRQGGVDFSQMLGSLAQTMAYQNARKPLDSGAGGASAGMRAASGAMDGASRGVLAGYGASQGYPRIQKPTFGVDYTGDQSPIG